MRAVVLHAAGDFRIEDRLASEPAPGQVQVRPTTGGICRSDLHYASDGAIRPHEPMGLGHEAAGHVMGLEAGALSMAEAAAAFARAGDRDRSIKTQIEFSRGGSAWRISSR